MYRFALAFLIAALPTQTLANGVTYFCELKSDLHGWVPAEILIEHSENGGARVHDEIVDQFSGGPQDAVLKEDSAKKLVVSWVVPTRDGNGQLTKMRYRAAMLKSSGKVIMTAKPVGYRDHFSGRGACRASDRHSIPAS
ncbi:unnamed protein product [Ectocarpus sp. 12 AP-2014]